MLYFRCSGRPSQQHSFSFPRDAFCCPHQTRRGQNQRQSSPETPQSCHPQPHHFPHMPLLTMGELPCSLYPTTSRLSAGYPEKILWINPQRKPKFAPQTVSFTLGWMQRAQAMVYQHKDWKMPAWKRKQWDQEITAAPRPGSAQDLSAGTICDSIF